MGCCSDIESAAAQGPAPKIDLKLGISTRGTLDSEEDIATVWPVWAGSAKLNLRATVTVCSLLLAQMHKQGQDLCQ